MQFNGVNWMPEEKSAPGVLEADKEYVFKYPRPPRPRALRVYECHIGMSSQEPKVNTYTEFKEDVLPRVRRMGYNAIQVMRRTGSDAHLPVFFQLPLFGNPKTDETHVMCVCDWHPARIDPDLCGSVGVVLWRMTRGCLLRRSWPFRSTPTTGLSGTT